MREINMNCHGGHEQSWRTWTVMADKTVVMDKNGHDRTKLSWRTWTVCESTYNFVYLCTMRRLWRYCKADRISRAISAISPSFNLLFSRIPKYIFLYPQSLLTLLSSLVKYLQHLETWKVTQFQIRGRTIFFLDFCSVVRETGLYTEYISAYTWFL